MKHFVEIDVMPRREISDPQGQTIERALPGVGFTGFEQIRVGKHIEMVVEAASEQDALEIAAKAAEKFLSNPVIEEFRVKIGTRT